jgi:hypothetical protein
MILLYILLTIIINTNILFIFIKIYILWKYKQKLLEKIL